MLVDMMLRCTCHKGSIGGEQGCTLARASYDWLQGLRFRNDTDSTISEMWFRCSTVMLIKDEKCLSRSRPALHL